MDQSAPAKFRRPILVWIILIFSLYVVGFTVFSFYKYVVMKLPVPSVSVKLLDTPSWVDFTILMVNSLVYLAASIALFKLKKVALPLAMTAFSITVLHSISHTPFLAIMAGYLIWIGIILYMWRLKARGVLV